MGFLQGLYALDVADGQVETWTDVLHVMVQSLLQCVTESQSPDVLLDSTLCQIS